MIVTQQLGNAVLYTNGVSPVTLVSGHMDENAEYCHGLHCHRRKGRHTLEPSAWNRSYDNDHSVCPWAYKGTCCQQ